MDPVSMGVMLAVSTAVSAAGAMQQAEAQSASYRAQAQAQDYNATVARNNAQVASEQANAQEEAQRRHFNALQGQANAGIAQSGTGFDGSNLDLLKQNAVNNELDALTIRYEGDNKAKGLIAQSQLDTYGAGVSRMNASSATQAGYWNAGSQLLAGATKYKYYDTTGKLT